MKRAVQGVFALFTLSAIVAICPTDASVISPLTISNTPVIVEDTTLILSQYYLEPIRGEYTQHQYYKLSVPINQVSMGGDLTFTAMEDDTTIYIEVLTDLNGDGYYEWLDSPSSVVRTTVTTKGKLIPATTANSTMDAGEQRTISTTDLRTLGTTAEQSRTAVGSTPLQELSLSASGDLIYCITTQGENGDSLTYYFTLDRTLDATTPTSILGAGAFLDVPSWSFYWNAVDWAARAGILNGVDTTHFDPDGDTTRGALMQVLYLQAGAPDAPDVSFSDVHEEDWYADAVAWGYAQGLVTGNGDGTFQPNHSLTREQLAVILKNAVGYGATDTADLSSYPDSDTVSPWAVDAMSWALTAGILDEMDGGLLNPQSTVSRATLAVVLQAMDKM